MSALFSPSTLRGVTLRNRIVVSPMCTYMATDGLANDWHLVHLASRAVGGAGLVFVEATGVSPEGRISPMCTGLWSDAHQAAMTPVVAAIKASGAAAGMQLAHAGRKASVAIPWKGHKPIGLDEGGWKPVAPSAVPFAEGYTPPKEMNAADLDKVVDDFVAAARRSAAAGFDVLEIHMAHGYLMHSFMSPIANKRTDRYGGSLENRIRFPLEVATAVREVWPEQLPCFVRISSTDWVEGGWDLAQSIVFAKALKAIGIDLVDCSSGAISADAPVPTGPGFQVPFAEAIRRDAGIATGAVGLITEPQQAEEILKKGQADLIFLGRAMLRDPYWALNASQALGGNAAWPPSYARGVRVPRAAKA